LVSVPGLGTAMLGLSTSARAHDRAVDRLLGAGALDGYPSEINEIGFLASQRSEFGPSVASLFRAMMNPFAARADVALTATELVHLAVPTLIVWGVDDVILTPARGRASADAIPNVTILEIDGGHAPWLNDLARVGDSVSTFLTE
ncbi:MAG: alpha/beta hydrolase, partial [Pseudolysinimonas sp.]